MYTKIIIIFLYTVLTSCSNENKHKENKEVNNNQEIANTKTLADTALYSENIYKELEGKWQSEEDKSYILTLKNNILIESISDSVIDSSKYFLLKYCSNVNSNEQRMYIGFNIKEENEIYCQYEVLGISKTNLTLMYVENGDITILKKIQ